MNAHKSAKWIFFPQSNFAPKGEELATGNTCAHQTENFLPSPFSSLLCRQTLAELLAPLAYFAVIFVFALSFRLVSVHAPVCVLSRPVGLFLPFVFLHVVCFPSHFHQLRFVPRFIHQSSSALGNRAICPPSNLFSLTSSFHLGFEVKKKKELNQKWATRWRSG